MSKEKIESEDIDVLDNIKKVEKAIKAKILIEKIGELKKYAKEINVLKEQSLATLEELNLSEKDVKRVIDYINELPDVKLTEREKNDIHDEISDDMTENKTSNEKVFRNINVDKFLNTPFVGYSQTSLPANSTWGNCSSGAWGNCSSGDSNLTITTCS
jgi:hypothetical protein